jgi:Uma2 family endonuclease
MQTACSGVAIMVATKLVTADELLAMGSETKRLELVRGEVRGVPAAGARHGSIGARLNYYLHAFVIGEGFGEVFGADTGFVVAREPDSVLMPDVAFVAAERIPDEGVWEGFVPFAPDLAVEIESPSNSQSELLGKVSLYLEGGSRLVWLVRPKQRTVTVFRTDIPEKVLGEMDTLTGANVLPGFTLPLAKLFQPSGRPS